MPNPFFDFRTENGTPVQSNGMSITPHSQAISLRLPFPGGVFTWNRPLGVTVQSGSQKQTFIPIVDVTRLALIALAGATLISFWIMRSMSDGR